MTQTIYTAEEVNNLLAASAQAQASINAAFDDRLKALEAAKPPAPAPAPLVFFLKYQNNKPLTEQDLNVRYEGYGQAMNADQLPKPRWVFPDGNARISNSVEGLTRIFNLDTDPKGGAGSGRAELNFSDKIIPSSKAFTRAFVVELGIDWPQTDETIIAQIHSKSGAKNPAWALSVNRGNWDLDERWGSNNPMSESAQRTIVSNRNLGRAPLDRLVLVVHEFNISEHGFSTLYFDDLTTPVYDYHGPFGYYAAGNHYIKQGVYPWQQDNPNDHWLRIRGPIVVEGFGLEVRQQIKAYFGV